MNSFLSKDYLDSFYSKALDEQYVALRLNLSPEKRNCEKPIRRFQQDSASDSTSAEEDCLKEDSYSIFGCNLFEKSLKTLKIKDALASGWLENLLTEKKKLLVRILRTRSKAPRSSGKVKNHSSFLHN